MAYIDGFPIWARVGWGLGVWGGLAGSILLLMRHRSAVPVLLACRWSARSSASATRSPIRPASPKCRRGVNAVMPYVIIAIALGLFVYARAMRIKGVLR